MATKKETAEATLPGGTTTCAHYTPTGYSATEPWQANFRLMAEKAAADPAYYARSPLGIRLLADRIRAGEPA